jgi:two-component system nitrate/nitrite response regulator NarL
MAESRRPSPETDPLSLVGAAVLEALELIELPAYVVGRKGIVRWANRAASSLSGDPVGKVQAYLLVLALPREPGEKGELTPRQEEVLRLLGEGLSTEAIAGRLGIAVETSRNHIRAVLRGLNVHSRLEAVVAGRKRGLL